jgi:hypothetical protein
MTTGTHEVPARADYFTPAQDALFFAALAGLNAVLAALISLIF